MKARAVRYIIVMSPARQDWDAFALLLIDLQRDFWPDEAAEAFPEFAERTGQLLTFCRQHAIEIIHLRARFRADGSDWMPKYRLQGAIPCVDGTEGVDVLPFAREEPGELVLEKQSFDAFQMPALGRHLQQQGRRFLLLGGLLTSVCVMLTAASACQHGFLTALVEDCCADKPEAHHFALGRYGFIFERTTVDQLATEQPRWVSMMDQLAANENREG